MTAAPTAPTAAPDPAPAPILDKVCWHCHRQFETRQPHQGLCPACERLADEDTRVTRIEGLTVHIYRDNLDAFLRAGDAAPPHRWWEGVPLPEPDATPPDPDALRQEAIKYTIARDVRRGL